MIKTKTGRSIINFHNIDNMKFMKDKPDNYYDLAIVDPEYGGNDAIGLKNNTGVKKQARFDIHTRQQQLF